MEVGKTKVLGIVDKNCIGIRHIQSALYDSGGDQDVIIAIDKGKHHLLQVLTIHLPMANTNTGIGY